MSDSLRSLMINERMSDSLIGSFLGKKRPVRSENRWANSQPCHVLLTLIMLKLSVQSVSFFPFYLLNHQKDKQKIVKTCQISFSILNIKMLANEKMPWQSINQVGWPSAVCWWWDFLLLTGSNQMSPIPHPSTQILWEGKETYMYVYCIVYSMH